MIIITVSDILQEFTINSHLGLQLISNGNSRPKTVILVNGNRISQCMYLMMELDHKDAEESHEYVNIDECSRRYSRGLENSKNRYPITAEEEFWGHCSNLQAWFENKYNPNVLHSSLSVPLLTKLAKTDIKVFDALLFHLDEMWKAYRTLERKEFVIQKYGTIIYDCLHLYSNAGEFAQNRDASVFASAIYKVKLFERWSMIGKMIRSNIRNYFQAQYVREAKAEYQRNYRRENKQHILMNRAERSIWGAGTDNLTHRKWLRKLRNRLVSVTSPIEDYPAYIWATHETTSSPYEKDKWRSFMDEYSNSVGVAQNHMWTCVQENMEYFFHIEWLGCYTSGWGYTTYQRKVLVRYRDGHYASKVLVMAR